MDISRWIMYPNFPLAHFRHSCKKFGNNEIPSYRDIRIGVQISLNKRVWKLSRKFKRIK